MYVFLLYYYIRIIDHGYCGNWATSWASWGQDTYQWASISVSVKLCVFPYIVSGGRDYLHSQKPLCWHDSYFISQVCISEYVCPYIVCGCTDCLTFILYRYELIMTTLLVFVPTSCVSLPAPTKAENEKWKGMVVPRYVGLATV